MLEEGRENISRRQKKKHDPAKSTYCSIEIVIQSRGLVNVSFSRTFGHSDLFFPLFFFSLYSFIVVFFFEWTIAILES